jgi:DNA-binding YbaB/EbfC family protein
MKGFDMGALGDIVKQAQGMQSRMKKLKNELKERVVEASAGGGMVKAQANGARELLAVKIQKDVVDPDDVEMLEDLVTAAVNEALKKAEKMHEDEMSKVTGGLNLPGMPGLF